VLESGLLDTVDVAALERAGRAKAGGARNLDELLADRPLDAFVLFSSNAAVWGSGGQAAYAAANAYLDALAERRRADGLVATSVAWGAWAGGGLAADRDAEEYLRRRGVLPMPPDQAIAALHRALSLDETTLAVARVDWERFVPGFTAGRRSPLLDDLPEVRRLSTVDSSAGGTGDGLADRLGGLDPEDRHRALLDVVCGRVAAVLGYADRDAIASGRPFKELGFDSLSAVNLRNELTAVTGLRLPTTTAFDHPTADELARHIGAELFEDAVPAPARAAAQLDRLETVLAGMTTDSGVRTIVAPRLRALLSQWDGADAAAPTDADDLAAASADDLFELIRQEFGKS
jgi:hypothetical protein